MAAPNRRVLKFDDLDEAVRDAEMLMQKGYDRAGNWDLGQVCGHLAEWMRYPVEGFPSPPLPIRVFLWLLGVTFARRKMRRSLETGEMPAGGPTIQSTIPSPGEDENVAVGQLRQSVERFKNYAGPIQPSPLFGPLDRDTALRMQLLHCSHHLGFLVPRD